MSDLFYISAIRSNAKRYESELNELHNILSQRNLSTFEYRACERTLQVSIESAIGVAKQVTKLLSGVSSVDAYQSFEVLSQHGFISLESLSNWRKVIGLRNALVHDYLNIDPAIVRSVVDNEYYRDIFLLSKRGLKS